MFLQDRRQVHHKKLESVYRPSQQETGLSMSSGTHGLSKSLAGPFSFLWALLGSHQKLSESGQPSCQWEQTIHRQTFLGYIVPYPFSEYLEIAQRREHQRRWSLVVRSAMVPPLLQKETADFPSLQSVSFPDPRGRYIRCTLIGQALYGFPSGRLDENKAASWFELFTRVKSIPSSLFIRIPKSLRTPHFFG